MKYIVFGVFFGVNLLNAPIKKQIDLEKIKEDTKEQEVTYKKLLKAIKIIESENNPYAYNEEEEAVGILQIRPVMIREVNRLLGYKKYNLTDRFSIKKSIQIFLHYSKFYKNYFGETTFIPESLARRWNGGPFGHKKKSTKKYWNKVKLELMLI